jgi:hypothetical protein
MMWNGEGWIMVSGPELVTYLGHPCLSGGWLDADLRLDPSKASCLEKILDYVLEFSEPF